MTKLEVTTQLQRLQTMYGTPTDDQIEIYIEKLRPLHELDLREGVDILLDSHPYKRFPLLAEVHAAIDLARERRPRIAVQQMEYCQRCENSGMYLVDDGSAGTARYCNCRFGRRLFDGHKAQPPGLRGALVLPVSARKNRRNLGYPGDQVF